MHATVEPNEESRVKVTVTVPADEFESAIDAAFRKIAREVRLPGFRPGKAPRRILEVHVGAEAGRQQALQDAIPGYYADAVLEHDIDVIAAPEINITGGEEEGDLVFEAVVEVRPVIEVVGYEALRVTVPYEPVDDAAVDAQVNRIRDQHAEYVDCDRPLALDDYATLSITGTQDGEAVDGLSVTGFGYVVGSGIVVTELDDNIRGLKTGESIEFDAVLPERFGERAGETVHFAVEVEGAQEKILPDLTDEWVDENTEWDDIASMREQLRSRGDLMGRLQAQMGMRDAVLTTLANLVEIDPPESLVDQETRTRINDFGQRLAQQGVDFDQYFAITGQDPQEFLEQTREQAGRAVLADLALRCVVSKEQIEASDAELDDEIAQLATRTGQKPERVRRDLVKGGVLEAVRSDIARGKALQFLVDRAIPVDENGNEIDISMPESPNEASGDTPAENPADPTE